MVDFIPTARITRQPKAAQAARAPHGALSYTLVTRAIDVALRPHRRAGAKGEFGTECRKAAHHDPASTRDISAGHSRSNPRPGLSQSLGLLRVSMVQSQRGHECRRPAGGNAGAVFMSQDGLHGLRADRSRCTAGLVAAYGQAAVVSENALRGGR